MLSNVAAHTRTTTSIATADMGLVLFSTPGTYKWKVPPAVRELKIQCWGGGGGGGQLRALRGGDGGGGGYVETVVEVFGREELTIVVATGGSGGKFGKVMCGAIALH